MRHWICFIGLILACVAYAKDGSSKDSARVIALQVQEQLAHLPTVQDSADYYFILEKVVKLALRCDQYDAHPNARGKVKTVYRKKHRAKLLPLYPRLIDGARYFATTGQSAHTSNILSVYLDFSQSQLGEGLPAADKGWAALWAAQLAFSMGDYSVADHMAELALADSVYAPLAAEVKIRCMRETMTTSIDSARYIIALLELHDKAPQNEGYFRMLTQYFTTKGNRQQMDNFAIDEIRKDSTNKLAWAFLGETKMKQHLWAEAIHAYQRAVALDSDFVEAMYNLGICYSASAQEDEAGHEKLSPDSCVLMLHRAKAYLEQVSAHRDGQSLDWVKPLYQVYLILGEKEKAAVLEQRLISGKDAEQDH